MPIYEYSCGKCGRTVELLQKMGTQEAGTPCPACGENALTKKLSVTAPAQMTGRPASGCELARQGGCGGCCQGGH